MTAHFLHRDDAPFSEKVWQAIDNEVVSAAKSHLSCRKLIYTDGPYGFGFKSIPSSDFKVEEDTADDIQLSADCATPLVMISGSFTIPARDIAAFEQANIPLDLKQVTEAAKNCAKQEDNLLFRGSQKLGLKGLLNAENVNKFKLSSWEEIGTAAGDIIKAVTALDDAGFNGPYALALSPDHYNQLFRIYKQGGFTEMDHIAKIVTGGIVKARDIETAGVLVDYGRQNMSVVVGQDMMTGFIGPENGGYEFNIFETVALRIIRPDAVSILK